MSRQASGAVDEIMERASRALEGTSYFDAARLARDGLTRARRAADFGRMARIILPLQEARRQIREAAADTDRVAIVTELTRAALEPGAYLVQPPLIGVDARDIRERAERRRSPVIVVAREPLTRDGLWPIVAIAPTTIRAKVVPPWPLERVEASPSKDQPPAAPPMSWMLAAGEALGDAAIAGVPTDLPPAWRVDDLLDALDAIPDHEKLAQALAAACRDAIGKPIPERARRRAYMDDPTSF